MYGWANYKGHKNARWIYSSPTSASLADFNKWAFYNASISACNVPYAVTIEALADDGVNKIVWNGSVLKLSSAIIDGYTVRLPNVSFIPGYNSIEVDTQNKGGAGGVIFDVVDANNNPVILSGAATTMVQLT